MEFELPKINVSFEYDKEKGEMVFVINGVEKRVKTEDMITEMEKLHEQNTALEQEPCEDCRNCNKWSECECGEKGHKNGTSIGYSIGECKDYKPCDCISRTELLKAVDTWDKFGCDADTKLVPVKDCYVPYIHYDDVVKAIKGMPSVQPKSKTGHWIAQDIYNCHTDFKCSECGYIHNFMHLFGKPTADYTYCPNCGAKMESEDK